MNNNDINIAIAEWCGLGDKYHIQKDGWFYKQNKCGYAQLPQNAGVFSREEAESEARSCNEIRIVKACHHSYATDLNAMFEAEDKLKSNPDQRGWESYIMLLDEKLGSGDKIHATARERAEALLRTIGKWKEDA